jgi:hypothetical protein
MFSLGLAVNASATSWPGPDDFGYRGMTIPFNWTDISGTGTFVPLSDDVVSGAVPIGFPFTFYGNVYTQAYISSNGFITFSSGQSDGCCSGANIPDPGSPNNYVAGFWEDLNVPQGGIHYQTVGNRFIVQFTNNPHYSGGVQVTFQMILHAGTNNIELQYLNAPTDGGTHTIGIEDIAGTRGLLYFNGSISMANTGLLIYLPQEEACAHTMNVPTSPTNVGTFAPGIFMSYDPMVARPFGLEDAGDILTGNLWLPCWRNGHVDVYLVLDESPYSGQYMLSELHQWLPFPAMIQPWMTYTDDDVYAALFSLQKSGILPGNYKLDVRVVPSGTAASTINEIVSGAAAAPYYKWSFTETLP